jgi:hypothetical protein
MLICEGVGFGESGKVMIKRGDVFGRFDAGNLAGNE